MNEAAREIGEIERFPMYCFSHMTCNAGDKAGFVLLTLYWKLMQKIFAQSQAAQNIWLETTGMAWPTYSETRWFSKYDVLQKISTAWGDMLTVMRQVVEDKIAPANSSKLLAILLDKPRSLMLQIELAAYVEGLQELRDLCYYLEAENTDIPFKCGDEIDKFLNSFPA